MSLKEKALRVFLLLSMLALAVGSVALSCESLPRGDGEQFTEVNTGPDPEGRIYTNWVFKEIRSVMLVNLEDRSRKIELKEKEWNYNPKNTELTIDREIPFSEYVVHLEGINRLPNTFVLPGYTGELFVFLQDRTAVRDYDYSFDQDKEQIVFREDVPLHNVSWLIRYNTAQGSASIGELKKNEDWDFLAYSDAERTKRHLSEWYDSQENFYFFDPLSFRPGDPTAAPSLVYRPATPEELKAMKDYPFPVFKGRYEASPEELARELGFKAVYPETIPAGEPGKTLPLAGKMIEEYVKDGTLVQNLLLHYGYGAFVELRVSRQLPEELDPRSSYREKIYLIDEETIDLGLPVKKLRLWAMVSASGPEATGEKPEVQSQSLWSWESDGNYYSLSALSEEDLWYETIIKSLLADG